MDWTTFVNEVSQNSELVIAMSALFVSTVTLIVTIVTINQTKKHNRLSVRPICHIYPPDFENHIAVIIQNQGVGPMITLSTKFFDSQNNISAYLIDLMPELPQGFYWNFFTKNQNFVIPANGEKILLELKGDETDLKFRQFRDAVRLKLSEINIEYEYTDIYEQKFQKKTYQLSWFGRNK